ncbi:MAG: 2OG-Fe(II) oxygenase [Rhodospirillales bacterium]
MAVLDLEALEAAPVRHDPCDYVVVPNFVRREMLAAVNSDYPAITEPGNFPPEDLGFGPIFTEMLGELQSPALKAAVARKFSVDLEGFPLQITVRKFSEADDGNVHNDSKLKVVTALLYFNETWPHEGGRLRLVRNPNDIDDFGAEVEPSGGTLLVFKRSQRSYHGFKPFAGERRSLQMYYVRPKRAATTEGKRLGLKKRLKRMFKVRSR